MNYDVVNKFTIGGFRTRLIKFDNGDYVIQFCTVSNRYDDWDSEFISGKVKAHHKYLECCQSMVERFETLQKVEVVE